MTSDSKTMSPAERLEHLRTKGMQTLVNLDNNINEKPFWFDEQRFARAKLVCDNFYVSIQFSSFTGLLLVLQLPDGLEPLLCTGNSKDLPSLYKRYLSTIMHVRSWYEDDIFDPNTKAYKSIRMVRGMHRRVAKLMNEKFDVPGVEGTHRTWVNQYDMALTQFAFIGLAMVWPQKCGLISASIDQLEGINYYWRVLGYMMGIDDEFNACAYDTYDQIHAYMKLMFEREYKQQFEELPCPIGLDMTRGIVTALQYYMPLVTFNTLAQWWAPCFTFNGYEPQPLSAREKLLAAWMKFSFNHVLRLSFLLGPFSRMHKRQFARRLKRKDTVYNGLVKKYADGPKFVSDRADYFNNNDNKSPAANASKSTANAEDDGGVLASPSACPFFVQTAYSKHFDDTFSNEKNTTNNDQAETEAQQTPVAVETGVANSERELEPTFDGQAKNHFSLVNNNVHIECR
ncbi:hypothetical protein GZH46_00734 [Fragariocoptes setiger]|uniref:ER-bound oxygenase mpaB/mpaB'/Rubber oxygenase catalytic domain-containing protein n=1 Tax=Fragariocoptes setiger TaxID=1670756 RepID=A0ABQ7SBD4_9ACAR|nr:hypothetical protein GZH46_00734 [Fragariocoptes setiger]